MKSKKIVISSILILVFTSLYFTSIFNSITANEELVFNAWGNLESTLQRRLDLIPNLVETVKGYSKHEKDTLQAVIEARSNITKVNLSPSELVEGQAMQQFLKQQDSLQSALSKLLVVVEKYPDLKANENFSSLQHQLEGTENRINYARTEYNEAAKNFNYTIRKFPNSLVNSLFLQLDKKPFYKANPEAYENVRVDFS